MLFITLLFKNDTYCTPYKGILLFKILLQIVAVSLIALNSLTCAPTLWSSNFVDHLYDYRPNCTPLSLITIINQQGSKKKGLFIIPSWQMKVLWFCHSAHYIFCVVQLKLWWPPYNWRSPKGDFLKIWAWGLEPCMDVFGQTLIQVTDSTHYNTENKGKCNSVQCYSNIFSMHTHK